MIAPTDDRLWDVAIVGAGPAGGLLAYLTAGAGLRVLLIERSHFPRGKVCGCCLNPKGVSVLHRVGLQKEFSNTGAVPLGKMHLGAGRSVAHLAIAGHVVSREALDGMLASAATSAGAEFRDGTTARLLESQPEYRELELTGHEGVQRIRSRVVIAADGLGSPLMQRAAIAESPPREDSHIGAQLIVAQAPDFYQPGELYMACGDRGYLGLVRLEDNRLDLACAVAPEALSHGQSLGQWANGLLQQVNWPTPEGIDGSWKGTPKLTRQASRLADHRLFVVGDAAGYIEPFTGQGMTWALLGAEALAPIVQNAVRDWRAEWIDHWSTTYHTQVKPTQKLCGWLAWGLRHPRMMRWATRGLSIWPGMARPVLKRLYPVAGRR